MSSILLKDRLEFSYGFSVRVTDEQSGEYPVFGSNGITGYIDSYKVESPGVIIGRKGSVGAIRFSNENFTPTDTAYYLLIKDKTKDDIKFWYYYLQLLGLEKLNTHSSVPGLSREIAYFVNVNPPDIKAQQKIAAVLSALDAKIELNQRINAELDSMAKTLYDYWFVQFDFPNEKGKPYKSAGGGMVWNEGLKREIPLGWEVYELSKIVSRIATGLNPRKNFVFGNGNNYYVTIKNIDYGKVVLDDRCDKVDDEALQIIDRRSDLQIGDILFTSIEPVGKTYLLQEKPKNWNINESVFTIRPNYELVTSEYLYSLLSSEMIKSFTNQSSAGSTFKGIRIGVLNTFLSAYPDKKLIYEFSEIVKPTLKKIDMIQKESQALTELHDWLLPMLMNGQVVVTG